ncbi:helix-turn-helix transcriptional regulator [Empedobacter tilapiae]
MAVNKNALIRYKTLDKCFSNPYRKYYINDLIETCNQVLTDHYGIDTTVSRRQIFIDIDFMKSDAGYQAPIDSLKDGRKVYYRYEDINFSILNKPLTQDEQLALENTVELLSRIKGIPGINALENLETKLIDVQNNSSKTNIISFEENEFLIGLEYLTILYNYIKNFQVLTITYKSFKSEQEQKYIISPYYLKQFNNRWFLFGWNHQEEYLQNLALDRLKTLSIDNQIYKESGVDFDEYFDDIIGVTNNLLTEPESIKIQLSDNIIPYIISKPIHGSQKVNQNILQLQLKLNYELESLILSYGENMKVLEPPTLVNKLKERIQKLNNFY